MKHVIEVDGGDASVLTESGNGGLIGRGLLADRPLAEYVDTTETPAYVMRNKKRGVSVERSKQRVGARTGHLRCVTRTLTTFRDRVAAHRRTAVCQRRARDRPRSKALSTR